MQVSLRAIRRSRRDRATDPQPSQPTAGRAPPEGALADRCRADPKAPHITQPAAAPAAGAGNGPLVHRGSPSTGSWERAGIDSTLASIIPARPHAAPWK